MRYRWFNRDTLIVFGERAFWETIKDLDINVLHNVFMDMEKILTTRVLEGFKKQIEDTIKLNLFKDKSKFIRFSILKTIPEFQKLEFDKNIISKSLNYLSEKENRKLDKRSNRMGRGVVTDISVLLSGIISSKGSIRRILELFNDCRLIFLFSSETFEELIRALYYLKILNCSDIFILFILLKCIFTKPYLVNLESTFLFAGIPKIINFWMRSMNRE